MHRCYHNIYLGYVGFFRKVLVEHKCGLFMILDQLPMHEARVVVVRRGEQNPVFTMRKIGEWMEIPDVNDIEAIGCISYWDDFFDMKGWKTAAIMGWCHLKGGVVSWRD